MDQVFFLENKGYRQSKNKTAKASREHTKLAPLPNKENFVTNAEDKTYAAKTKLFFHFKQAFMFSLFGKKINKAVKT
jgi:hypothetical protein